MSPPDERTDATNEPSRQSRFSTRQFGIYAVVSMPGPEHGSPRSRTVDLSPESTPSAGDPEREPRALEATAPVTVRLPHTNRRRNG